MLTLKSQHILWLALSVLVIVLLPTLLFAFQNEPDGFRGIKWGTNIEKLSDMGLVESGSDLKVYKKKNDKMKIGDADIKSLLYFFYKKRLGGVMINFNELKNYSDIKETFFQLYGSGNRPNQFMERYYWFGSEATVTLEYNEVSKEGQAFYSYIPIREEEKTDKIEKAKKGTEDL